MKRTNTVTHAWLRHMVQAGFLVFCILLGLEFRRFVLSLEAAPGNPIAWRPPAVEAFLPISALMSFVQLVRTGVADRVHPAGLVIFTAALASSFLFKRGFCSWVCPIGTLSEMAHPAGKRLLGRNLRLPVWPDRILRSAKYLLLGFFLYSILRMSPEVLHRFLNGAYNRMADVKMYLFFAQISLTAFVVLAVLTVLSVLVKNFWCRYLCPYGALLGIVSLASPMGWKRDPTLCDGCGRCDRACPNRVRVSTASVVRSEECTACFGCGDVCPREGALRFGAHEAQVSFGARTYAALMVAAFVFVPHLFSALGYWQTEQPPAMFRGLYHMVHQIEHPRGGNLMDMPPVPPEIGRPPER